MRPSLAGGRAATLGAAIAGCLVSPHEARSADWRGSVILSERLLLEPNLAFEEGGEQEAVLSSFTTLGFSFVGASKRTNLSFSPGVTYRATTDDGARFESFNDVNPRFSGSVTHAAPRANFGVSASVIPREVNFNSPLLDPFDPFDPLEPPPLDPDDPIDDEPPPPDDDLVDEVVDERAIQITASANAFSSFRLDKWSTLRASLSFRAVEYSEENDRLTPQRSYGGGLSTSRRLDDLSGVNVALNYRRFETEGDDGRKTDTLTATVGGDRTLSEDLSFGGNVGATFSQSERDGESDANTSLVTSFRVSYGGLDTSDLGFGFSASQSVSQNAAGEIVNRTSLRVSADYPIDARSGLGFGAGLLFDRPLVAENGENSQSLNLNAFYRRALSPDWQARGGVSMRVRRDDDEDGAVSTFLFMSVSRSFTLF